MGVQLDEHTWLVGHRRLRLPVRVRDAALASLTVLAPASAVRRRLAGTGLEPLTALGRSPVSLMFVNYRDSDLGSYSEVGTVLTVLGPDHVPGVFVTQLPVTAEFTQDAGCSIWALPKWLARCDLSIDGAAARCELSDGPVRVLSARLRSLPFALPLGAGTTITAYTVRAGTLLRTEARTRVEGVRVRPGGAVLTLGGAHPMATELRDLGLPRRVLATTVVRRLTTSIGPARPV